MTAEATRPLDRVVWHALTGRQAALAEGNALALRYGTAYTPFAATLDDTPASLAALHTIIPPAGAVALATTDELALPPALSVRRRASVEQMLLTDPSIIEGIPPVPANTRVLGDADVPAMMALVALTQPGPFAARTHTLGRYLGVFDNNELIAMAGERMRLDGFVEVSAVCTHPNHRGKALSASLIAALARPALARGEIPFLHVFTDNAPAIAVYHRLGFSIRTTLHLAVVARAGD
jgi:predicted GNAT family acetyltransferase